VVVEEISFDHDVELCEGVPLPSNHLSALEDTDLRDLHQCLLLHSVERLEELTVLDGSHLSVLLEEIRQLVHSQRLLQLLPC
jgi:hypothetical protein